MNKMTKIFKPTERDQAIAFVNYVSKFYTMRSSNEFYGLVVEIEYNPSHGEQLILEVAYENALNGTL